MTQTLTHDTQHMTHKSMQKCTATSHPPQHITTAQSSWRLARGHNANNTENNQCTSTGANTTHTPAMTLVTAPNSQQQRCPLKDDHRLRVQGSSAMLFLRLFGSGHAVGCYWIPGAMGTFGAYNGASNTSVPPMVSQVTPP